MKKRCLIFLASLLALGACSGNTSAPTKQRTEVDFDQLDDNDYTPSTGTTGELGEFSLISPNNGETVDSVSKFSWQASNNADKYTLEFSTSDQFIRDNDRIDYYCLENIDTTSWTIGAALPIQNVTYYWRVFAVNASGKRQSEETFSFFYVAHQVEEVEFDIGAADEWKLHSEGSYAEISIDKSNFFENDKDSLKIAFDIEHTKQGNPESDGWIVVTKTIEKSIYGTDALYFNLYYAGQDAEVYIRLVDRDNEYWVCPVMLSLNAKQKVILKFTDFVQRKVDVPVANETFDVERIKYMEVVFEKSFGDGILLMSDVRAIKFSNYSDFFISKLDFTKYSDKQWESENYEFTKMITENQLILGYSGTGTATMGKIEGYGFARLVVNQYFATGDAIKVSLKYAGAKSSNTNALIRIVEEDTDRWSFKFPFSDLSNTYKTFVIPFSAFAKSATTGDGKRQFYSIANIQFGLENQTGTGVLYFQDFEVITKDAAVPHSVGVDGLVEDFDGYNSTNEVFLDWSASDGNKDEYIQLNNKNKLGGSANKYVGQFEYKSDMEAATYTLPITTEESFSSLQLWLKDASIKTNDARFGHVKNWSAYTTIYVTLETDEIYHYTIGTIDRIWKEFNVPFDVFELDNAIDLDHDANNITSETIKSISVAFQYFYYSALGAPQPQYTNSNPVYVDNIYLAHETEVSSYEKEKVVRTNEEGLSLIDDFEQYHDTADMEDYWQDGLTHDYQKKELSQVVSSEGGKNSMALQMKAGKDSPSYTISPAFDQEVLGRAVKVDLFSEKELTVYINLYITIGSASFQYRATIEKVATTWTSYTLGLNYFKYVGGNFNRPLSAPDLIFITKMSFGMVYNDGTNNLYNLYVDNLMFDYNQLYSVNETRVIPEEVA